MTLYLTIKQYDFIICVVLIGTAARTHFTYLICTWPPSDDLVHINIFLNIPTTARFYIFFFIIFNYFIGYIHLIKCIFQLLNITLYTNEQTSIKLKLNNIWSVVGLRWVRFKIIRDLWYCEIMYYRFTAISRNMQYFI